MTSLLVRTLHKRVWHRLPVALRRAAILGGSKWLAPRITREAESVSPLIVVGLLKQASGLGAAARACHDALVEAGAPVYAIDVTNALKYEENFSGFTCKDGRSLVGKGTLLLHIPGPLIPLALMRLGRSFVRDKRVIAHWFWELQKFPRDWRVAVPFVHEVFVNTRFVADAMYRLSGRQRVHVVPYPLPLPATPRKKNERARTAFTVLVVFNVLSNFARKNPCAAIAAFRQAFGGQDAEARLIIKHSNSAHWPKSIELMREAAGDAGNIEFIGETLDQSEIDALYAGADVVLSLHRSEGLGLVIVEAMLRGVPVIATNWSGSSEFLSRETGMLVGYDLVPVVDPQGNYVGEGMLWADPHIDEAVAALRSLRADPRMRERLGQAAAAMAAQFFDPARYVDRVRKLVRLESAPDKQVDDL